ncbi:hypothetical protein AF331_09405 [Rossellomorea marisflavi]|uniref:ATP-grasp domain-containing protein n=2 Tax=Rossellomorea marisflavi TaxID=189381 RepID=A0A0M0GLD6_9BACI|nr:ATP-grasp domain-containing protein [Rossellomorea marisflavi]KON90578.1 hypothetical protein AF331_09405 [Rossellomorea marisflavi]MCM2591083.1 ATP-grasp domain-containing protein [Rossellomorea marisflavi]
MFIIKKENVSPMLMETAQRLHIPVIDEEYEGPLVLDEHSRVLTNSEACLQRLNEWAPQHPFTRISQMVKQKATFRAMLSDLFPDYYYQLVSLQELRSMPKEILPFPLVIKPNKGYSSVGVKLVQDHSEWDRSVAELYGELTLSKGVYSESVVDQDEIIIEKWIDGEEYAVDCYFDHEGKPVILNILKRMFASSTDTSDRMYYTSTSIVAEVFHEVEEFLHKLSGMLEVSHYPFHLELRRSEAGMMAIELNPLRFAGAGTTDISTHAYGINGAEAYMLNERPDWSEILTRSDDRLYGFCCIELPVDIVKQDLHSFDHEALKERFTDILEYRNVESSDDQMLSVVFFRTSSMEEVHDLLHIELNPYITEKKVGVPS